jgi:hypothetical protein
MICPFLYLTSRRGTPAFCKIVFDLERLGVIELPAHGSLKGLSDQFLTFLPERFGILWIQT